MALTTQTGIPGVMECGNTYLIQETFSAYPPATFTLALVIQIPGNAALTFNATTSGSSFLFTLTNTNTESMGPGTFFFSEYATEIATSNRVTAKTGIFQMIPNLADTQAISAAQTMLNNINTAITNLTTGGFMSVSANGVSYTRYDLATLISQRTRLQAEVKREQLAAEAFRGVETSGRIGTRFKPSPSGVPFFSKDIGE